MGRRGVRPASAFGLPETASGLTLQPNKRGACHIYESGKEDRQAMRNGPAGDFAAFLLSPEALVFLLPFGASVFFLVISSLRLSGGHKHAGRTGRGHTGHTGHTKHAAKPGVKTHNAHKNVLLFVIGANRAPLPLVVQTFCFAWGICGIAISRALNPQGAETGGKFLLCLLIALLGGLIGARVGAEFLARLMPEEGSQVVSRDALYGLTGKVLFPVTEKSGRVRVYDEFGTMHDEPCRRAKTMVGEKETVPIAKGRTVRIVDRDAGGKLLVEEA